MTAEMIHTDAAPAAVGPYSQAVRSGSLVFLSGQIALVPETMKMVGPGFEEQAEQVFRNLQAVAEAAGSSLDRAVKITIYLTDLTHFAAVNEIMQRHCEPPYPARATIGVAALPGGAVIEAEAILTL